MLNKIISLISLILLFSCSSYLNYDKNIEKFLKKNNYEFSIDHQGDFKINHNSQEIYIRSKTNEIKTTNIEIRDVFAIAYSQKEAYSQKTLQYLMMDSYNNLLLGSWAIIFDKDTHYYHIVYSAKIDKKTHHDILDLIIREASSETKSIREALLNQE